jgi:hypothetical protein
MKYSRFCAMHHKQLAPWVLVRAARGFKTEESPDYATFGYATCQVWTLYFINSQLSTQQNESHFPKTDVPPFMFSVTTATDPPLLTRRRDLAAKEKMEAREQIYITN